MEYPSELESFSVTDAGLKLMLRPIKHSDGPLLKRFFYTLSPESVYNRFLSPIHDVTDEQVHAFVEIDYELTMAIAAVIISKNGEEILGVARYVRQDGQNADVAVVVSDAVQNQGIGTILLDRLTEIAKDMGIKAFTSSVDPQNIKLLRFAKSLGFERTEHFDGDLIELTCFLN